MPPKSPRSTLRVGGWLLSFVLLAPTARASELTERLSERGPATFAVGLIFSVTAPFGMLRGAATGGPVAIHACRFGHGLKMLTAGSLLLPLGLLAAPFHPDGVPAGWMDGVVEAFQEDICSRPLTSVYP